MGSEKIEVKKKKPTKETSKNTPESSLITNDIRITKGIKDGTNRAAQAAVCTRQSS